MNSFCSAMVKTFFGPCEDLGGGDALVLQRGEAAGEDALADQGERHAEVERGDHGPFAGALLSGGVEDLVDQRLAVVVLLGEDVGGDFDEVAVEFALVPLGEDLVRARRRVSPRPSLRSW